MINLESILLGLLVVDAIALVVLILLQQGKGVDVGAAFGSGGANTVFGGAGSASVLAKLTTWLAIGFFALSFGLAFAAKERAATISDIGLPQVSVPEQGEPGEIGEAVIISGTAAEESAVDDVPNLDEAVDALESAPESSPSDVPDV
jgi:preprotein translocase subunit SecG